VSSVLVWVAAGGRIKKAIEAPTAPRDKTAIEEALALDLMPFTFWNRGATKGRDVALQLGPRATKLDLLLRRDRELLAIEVKPQARFRPFPGVLARGR
jgi:hypothetical protein